MRYLIFFSLFVVGLCLEQAVPSPPDSGIPNRVQFHQRGLQIPKDATCGARKGYTCWNSRWGNCCSKEGYCGSSDKYCGEGCQSKFGFCRKPYKPISWNGKCGNNGRGATCLGSKFGKCCSHHGLCGASSYYCGKGCQSSFGICYPKRSPSSSSRRTSSTRTSTQSSSTSSSSITSTVSSRSSYSSSSSSTAVSSSEVLSSSSSVSSTISSSSSSPSPSGCPPGSPIGTIQVINSITLAVLGFVSKNYDGQNSFKFDTVANALQVQFQSGSTCNDLAILTLNGPAGPAGVSYFGAVGGSAGYNFNPGNLGYAYYAGTAFLAPNSPPSFAIPHSIQPLGYNAPAETSIWNYDLVTGLLTPKWTNVDGSQPPTSNFYDPAVDFLGAVGDFTKFTTTFPNEGAYLVNLKFVPQ